jgi:hypothetical protein
MLRKIIKYIMSLPKPACRTCDSRLVHELPSHMCQYLMSWATENIAQLKVLISKCLLSSPEFMLFTQRKSNQSIVFVS